MPRSSFGKRRCKVEEADEVAICSAFDDLMQIDAIVEASELLHGVRIDAWDLQRSRELQLEDADAGTRQSRQALRSALELDRGVADVIANPKMTPECCFRGRCIEPRQIGKSANGCR